MDRAQLEQLALQKISQTQAVPSSKMDRAALEQMALRKMSNNGMTEIDQTTEADLGFINRAKYSIEPIQSNRKALLEEQYGQDNVMEKNGELFLKQDNKFVPLNKDGISFSDATDFLGATPEMVGSGVGIVAGAIGGGGALSVPAAIGLGAAGGAAGSMARQGFSGMLGNPQVATGKEIALETGLSGLFGGAGAGVGLAVKAGVQKAKPGITNIIKNLTKGSGEIAETVGENTTKTVSNSTSQSKAALSGELIPNYSNQTAEEITATMADQSGRSAVQNETAALARISAQENIPSATKAQATQGTAIIAEHKILDMPLIGGKVRKIYDSQLEAIKNNIEKITGKFIDVDSSAYEVGLAAREQAETIVASTKQASQELYEQVAEEGAEAMIGKTTFFNKFRDQAGKLGLINPDLSKAEWAADSGLSEETFKKLQGSLFSAINALNKNPSSKIRFEAANAIVKSIKQTASEMKVANPNGHRLLSNFTKELNVTLEKTLNREAPKLGEKFAAANKGWAQYKDSEKALKSIFKNLASDEHVSKNVMSGTAKVAEMQKLIGNERVKELAVSHLRDMLGNLGKSGIGRADSVMTAVKKQGPAFKAALGEKEYTSLINNLHFLNRTGQSIGVSRASLYNLMGYAGKSVKSLGLNIVGDIATTAKTLAESKGTTITKAVKDKAIETTGKLVPTTSKGASAYGNILGDNSQRSWASHPSYKSGNVTEQEKTKRQRAISGSKP
jgi:hypothetical protein